MQPESDEQEQLMPLEQKQIRRKRQDIKPKYNQKIIIELDMIIAFCLECVTWDEAKPVVHMLEKMFGMHAPPVVKQAISMIKKKFGHMIYGNIHMHIAHSDMTVGVAEEGSELCHHYNHKVKWKKHKKQKC